MDGQTCLLGFRRVWIKIELHVEIHFYVLSFINTVG
jgi:hypothetical protein